MRAAAARRSLLLVLAALLTSAAAAPADLEAPVASVRVGVSGIPKWPYWYPQGDDGSMVNVSDPYAANWTGFLRPLLDAACEGASLDCELVFFKELTERIPLVQNGEVDFIIDTLSATDERAQQVDFVSPGFFSAGVSLYTTPEQAKMLEAAGGWEGLANLTVCIPEGYYATEALKRQFGIVVIETKIEDAVDAVKGDTISCNALAYDSGQPQLAQLGLPEAAGVVPVLTTRYAIPVKKGNDALRRRLSAALVEVMQAGTLSPILEWEQQWLTDNGVPPNAELFEVVQAISYFQ